jgi:two-component system, sensor histidine kinase and response regulator
MPRALVVDDNAINRELLRAYLELSGYEVVEAESGEAALEAAAASPPDVVLLDVMMPGLNGFTTASLLKERAEGFLPIIMVTGLNDASSKLLGLRAGADDFLTKPVDRFEMAARLNNLLKLRQNERELEQRNERLIELQRFRDEMAELIVHDLKNPMSVIMANLEYVLDDPRAASIADLHDALDDARRGGQRALRLLANLLDLSRLESNRLVLTRTWVTVDRLVQPIVDQRARHFAARDLHLDVDLSQERVSVDVDLITRALENILDNTLRYTPIGGRVGVSARRRDAMIDLRLGNSGPPVPVSERERIFDKFGQAGGAQRTNLGLGLYLSRMVVEAHGGQLRVDEAPGFPTVFQFSFPASADG